MKLLNTKGPKTELLLQPNLPKLFFLKLFSPDLPGSVCFYFTARKVLLSSKVFCYQ